MLGSTLFVLLLNTCLAEVICEGSIKAGAGYHYDKCSVQLIRKQTNTVLEDESVSPNGYFVIPVEGRSEDYFLRVSAPSRWILDRETAEVSDCLKGDVDFIRTGLTTPGEVSSPCGYPLPEELLLSLSSRNEIKSYPTVDSDYQYQLPTDITAGSYFIYVSNYDQFKSLTFSGVEFSIPATEFVSGPVLDFVTIKGKASTFGKTVIRLLHGSEVLQEQDVDDEHVQFKIPCNERHDFEKLFVASSSANATFNSPINVMRWGEGEVLHLKRLKLPVVVRGPSNTNVSMTVATAADLVVEFDGTFDDNGQFVSWIWLSVDTHYTITTNCKSDEVSYKLLQHVIRDQLSIEVQALNIYPSTVRVCALLDLHPSHIVDISNSEVTLWDDEDTPQRLQHVGETSFCIMSARSNSKKVFKLTASLNGVSLSPSEFIVPQNLFQQPELFSFKELTFQVLCSVTCLNNGCELKEALEGLAKSLLVVQKGVDGREPSFRFESHDSKSKMLTIRNIPTGSYNIQFPGSAYCWEGDISFEVERDISISIRQSGYIGFVKQHFGIPVSVLFQSGGSQIEVELINDTSHEVCLPRLGEYSISISQLSCFKIDPIRIDDTTTRINTNITSSFVTVKGMIKTNQRDGPTIKVFGTDPNAKIIVTGDSYELRGKPGAKVSLQIENNEDSSLRYFPQLQELELPLPDSETACDVTLKTIHFKEALLISGKTMPPVEGAVVSLGSSEYNQVYSDAEGLFTILGPLPTNLSPVRVAISKVGFTFTPNQIVLRDPSQKELVFEAASVSSLVIKIIDINGEPIPSLLVSVSSESGTDYKKSSKTQKDGKITFSDLEPGSYFVKYYTKAFELKSESVTVSIGEEKLIQRVAEKSGFSISGRTQFVNNSDASNVMIEIVSDSGIVREALSSDNGLFKAVGLPSGSYNVSVRLERVFGQAKRSVSFASPLLQSVRITADDVNLSPFTVLLMPNTIDIIGVVSAPNYWNREADVTLSASSSVIRRQPLPPSKLFQFNSVRIPTRDSELESLKVTVTPRSPRDGDFLGESNVLIFNDLGIPLLVSETDVQLEVKVAPPIDVRNHSAPTIQQIAIPVSVAILLHFVTQHIKPLLTTL